MKIFLLLFIILAPPIHAFGETASGPLEFNSTHLWNIELSGDAENPSYQVTYTKDESALLYINTSSFLQTNKGKAHENFQKFATRLLAELKKDSRRLSFELTDYEIGTIAGVEFSGKFVRYTIENRQGKFRNSSTNALFMLSNGRHEWSVEYSGNRDRWNEAIAFLKTMKQKGLR